MEKLEIFKLGLGPMSPEIVDLCLEYSYIHDYPIMIIASRNQADFNSGYAFTTSSLINHVLNNIYFNPARVLICRDHCGPYYSDFDQGLMLQDAIDRCIKTITTDIKHGFDLIHVDVSKVPVEQQMQVATTLIEVAKSANDNIMIEFGSEENIGEGAKESLINLKAQLAFATKFKPNLKFFVSQTGSLTKHTQVGKFNESTARIIADLIHDAELLFKEHNADYLTKDEVALRQKAGIDALNVAPQLGSIQTSIFRKLGQQLGTPYTDFKEHVLSQGYWKRWTTSDIIDTDTQFLASGHYCFKSDQAIKLREVMGEAFIDHLRIDIFAALDEYRLGVESQ